MPKSLSELIYQWGRLATTFYPAGRWRWEKEWDHYRRYDRGEFT